LRRRFSLILNSNRGEQTSKRRTALRRSYHTIHKQRKAGERELAAFLLRNGQALLPMLELIEQSRLAVDERIDVMGRACIEAVLALSARQVAGPPQQGKARQGDIVWHGAQPGRVRPAHARDPVAGRIHAALSARDSGDGRHGGRVEIDGEP
jgi:hypothetical protein